MEGEKFSVLPTEEPIPQSSREQLGEKDQFGEGESKGRSWLWGVLFYVLVFLVVVAVLLLWRASLKQEREYLLRYVEQVTAKVVTNVNNATRTKSESQLDQDYANALKNLVKSSNDFGQRLNQLEKTDQEIAKKVEEMQVNIKLQEQQAKLVSSLKEEVAEVKRKGFQNQKLNLDRQELVKIKQDISKIRLELKALQIENSKYKEEINKVATASRQEVEQTIKKEISKIQEPVNTKINEVAPPQPTKVQQKEQNKKEILPKQGLYNESTLAQKAEHQKDKLFYIDQQFKDFPGVEQARYNLDLSESDSDENLQYSTEMMIDLQSSAGKTPFCVIVPTYLSLPLYFLEYSLNSIFRQHYSPLLVVLFSSPREEVNKFLLDYLRINAIPEDRYRFQQRTGSQPVLENIALAIGKHCQAGSMAVVMQGGNELLGKYVLEIYNVHIQEKGLAVVYSNHYQFKAGRIIKYGDTYAIQDQQLKQNIFRKQKRTQFQLLAFSTDLFKQIKPEDLKDKTGNFLKGALTAVTLPILELSCGRGGKVGGIFYLQNLNEQFTDKLQAESKTFQELSSRPSYSCDSSFNKSAQEKRNIPVPIPPELEAISLGKHKQLPGMMDTPKGHVSLIDPYFKNEKGQRIADVVYPYQYLRNIRINLHKRKIAYINAHKGKKSLHLAKYNLKFDTSLDEQQKIDEAEQYQRLNTVYHFEQYKQEIPICVIVPTVNNQAQSRFQYSLNAIFTQNYTNYFVVIINDASTDNSDLIYRQYLHFYNIPPQRYAYIHNKVRKTAMTNIYDAEYNYCSEDSITIISDGDDQILGKNAFKTYNAAYQRLKGGAIYSNYYFFTTDQRMQLGSSKQYSNQTKKSVSFRKEYARYSHLRSHRTALFRSIDKSNFQDASGNFYEISCDVAMYIPLMEKACGRVYYIDEYFYLYNTNTGMNDHVINARGQEAVVKEVRRKPKLECAPQYKDVPFLSLL